MVLCQTFKFTESVLLDSFCDNDIGDPEEVVAVSTPGMSSLLKDWRSTKNTLNVGHTCAISRAISPPPPPPPPPPAAPNSRGCSTR